jgi:hypothetical protein
VKLQLQSGSLRVRVDEAELAQLLAGGQLALSLGDPAAPLFRLQLELADGLHFEGGRDWRLSLPRAEVESYRDTLPNKAARRFLIDGEANPPLALDFEVDVRDSLQHRGPRRRQPG